VIPDPMIHKSASSVRLPLLPSVANGFASVKESIQNDFVGLGTGRLAGGCEVGRLRTVCSTFHKFKGTDNVDIVIDEYRPTRSSSDRIRMISMSEMILTDRWRSPHVALPFRWATKRKLTSSSET
jgi:hypothetical protein